jgi:hypothetical protein
LCRFHFARGGGNRSRSIATNVAHTYAKNGTFTITLKVFDPSTNQKIGEANAAATIDSAPTPGEEIYTDWNLRLNVGGGGKTFGGSIKSHSIYNNVDTDCQDFVDIQFSGMKLYKFDHEFVSFAATTAEAKTCVSYLKYWDWYMHYEGYDTLAFCGMSIYR